MTVIETSAAFERLPGEGPSPLILLCDHAGNALPPAYGSLGLPAAEFERHIAYDIGARDLTLGLGRRLGAVALLTRYSRLLIDPNRGTDDPTLIMKLSDGAVISGNARIGEAERQLRTRLYHAPYHRAIAAEIDRLEGQGIVPVLISIHSFTPWWKGHPRPWHAGVLWDRDETMAQAMIAALRAPGDIVVGDNEPYSGALPGDTLATHGTALGLPRVLIEVRQDLIAGKSGVDEWTSRLARAIEAVMKEAPGRRARPR